MDSLDEGERVGGRREMRPGIDFSFIGAVAGVEVEVGSLDVALTGTLEGLVEDSGRTVLTSVFRELHIFFIFGTAAVSTTIAASEANTDLRPLFATGTAGVSADAAGDSTVGILDVPNELLVRAFFAEGSV
jgi:hypothetical protein